MLYHNAVSCRAAAAGQMRLNLAAELRLGAENRLGLPTCTVATERVKRARARAHARNHVRPSVRRRDMYRRGRREKF